MNAAEIVVGKMRSYSGSQMRQLLAERIGEARETAHRHSHRQVLPLYERRADVLRIGIAHSDLGYNLRDWAWGVPPFGTFELPMVKQLHKLREVYVQTKAHGNHSGVMIQSIGRELNGRGEAFVQVPKKRCRGFLRPLANKERRHQFGLLVNRHEYPLVSDLGRIALSNVPSFLLNERPDFVNLQIPGLDSAHPFVHQSGAAFTSDEQKPHDRISIDSCEPLGAADRAAFQEAMQRTHSRIRARSHRAQRGLGLRFGKRCTAGLAAPSLNAALTEVTRSVCRSGAGI